MPADALILATVAEYRYATTAMLSAITGLPCLTVNRRTHRSGNTATLGARHLVHPQTGGGSSPSIHVLDEQGLAWLSERGVVAERHLRSLPPATTHTPTADANSSTASRCRLPQ